MSQATSTTLSFTVPDRNGDGQRETLSYRINNNQLERSEAGGTYYGTGLTATGLTFSPSAAALSSIDNNVMPSGRVVLQSYSTQALGSEANSMSLALPPGTTSGDLLVYAIGIEGNETSNFAISGTWQSIAKQAQGSSVTACVGWRAAVANEVASHSVTWTSSRSAVGYIMRFSGANSAPIASSQVRNGSAAYPQSGANAEPYLASVTSAANLTVMRFIAFDRDALIGSSSGLTKNVHLPMLKSSNSATHAQGLAVVRQLTSTADESGNQLFAINVASPFVAVTVAIKP